MLTETVIESIPPKNLVVILASLHDVLKGSEAELQKHIAAKAEAEAAIESIRHGTEDIRHIVDVLRTQLKTIGFEGENLLNAINHLNRMIDQTFDQVDAEEADHAHAPASQRVAPRRDRAENQAQESQRDTRRAQRREDPQVESATQRAKPKAPQRAWGAEEDAGHDNAYDSHAPIASPSTRRIQQRRDPYEDDDQEPVRDPARHARDPMPLAPVGHINGHDHDDEGGVFEALEEEMPQSGFSFAVDPKAMQR